MAAYITFCQRQEQRMAEANQAPPMRSSMSLLLQVDGRKEKGGEKERGANGRRNMDTESESRLIN